jgi:hypothetical protein
MPIEVAKAAIATFALATNLHAAVAQEAPALRLTADGRAERMFDAKTDRCAPVDMPDVNARAFRTADGRVSMFVLHYQARALRGHDLLHLEIDCRVALDSSEDADPAKYDGRRYITATWTPDGKRVAALIHDEYHADHHPGRCLFKSDIECWWNAILSFRSDDGGANFAPSNPLVVAAAPFKQDVGQGRHRGFFNPSNMFAKEGYVYAFTSTTGWEGQSAGACLIRNRDPLDSAGWRGWDGREFSVRWRDPYDASSPPPSKRASGASRGEGRAQASCAPIEPFFFPVGSVVRHRATGAFVAVWEAPRVEGRFATSGLYYATSRDLIHWSQAALLAATPMTHAPCGPNESNRDGWIVSYPSLMDADAQGRNFDDTGDAPWLFYARIKNNGCTPGADRVLMRQRISITPAR